MIGNSHHLIPLFFKNDEQYRVSDHRGLSHGHKYHYDSCSLRRPEDVEDEPTSDGRAEQGLGPVDGGAAAWRLLCAAFMFEALLWGKFPLCIELSRHGS